MLSRHQALTIRSGLAAATVASLSLLDTGCDSGTTSVAALAPAWIAPAEAPIISSQPVLFRWSAVPGADRYRLRVGTAPGKGDVLHLLGLQTTSHRAGELPPARPLYARVSAHRDGRWRHSSLRFMVEPVAGEWIHPVPGSPEAEAGRAFEWTPVPGASEYRLVIGSDPVSTDLLDRIVGKRTRVKVEDLPVGRRLFARVYTRTRDTWYWRDADFAIQLGYRGASPIHPQPGGIADLCQPFRWQPVPLATGYRLRIGSRPGGSELHDSGVVRVARRFVEGLPADRKLHATLTTVYADRSAERRFEFRAQPGAPSEKSFVAAALDATATVRAMAGSSDAWPRSLLGEVVREQGKSGAGCEEFAHTLLRALTEQRNGLPSRFLGTCLLGNSVDCHALVELYLPGTRTWMILDPTFAIAARRADGQWASAADLSDAVRRESWTEIRFVPLDRDSVSRLRSYYLDYPLLFVSPFGQDPPRADVGPSILHYYEEVALPVRERGAYAIRCLGGPAAELLLDGRPTSLTCQGRDGLSEVRVASSIEQPQENTIRVYRPRRFVF